VTHLIPSPRSPVDEQGFADDVRAGGFSGALTIGRDLDTFEIDAGGVEVVRRTSSD
jgi:hypothetical protein